MGSPNHYQSEYPTLGLDNDPDTSEETIADYRANLDDSQNDLSNEDYVESAKQLAEALSQWVNAFNDFEDFEDDTSPFKFELEYGYHEGFRIAIVNEWFGRSPVNLELAYDNSVKYKTIPSGMTFEQFKNCYEKVEAYCIYTMQELVKTIPLHGVSGGWCGGSYYLDENTQADHDRFKKEFDTMYAYIKKHTNCVWW